MTEFKNPFPFKILTAGAVAEANSRTPKLICHDYKIITIEFVERGGGYVEYAGKPPVYCPANSIYFLHRRKNFTYYHDPKKPWKKIFCNFDGELADYLLHLYGLDEIIMIPDVTELHKYFMEFKHAGFGCDEEHAVIFHRLLEHCRRLLKRSEQQLADEIKMLKNELDLSIEKNFSLKKFALKINFSEAHLINNFQKSIGATPYEYLLNAKIMSAKNLLTHTNLSIKEIADILKFSDQYYFSNFFKQKNGVSPLQYRKQQKIIPGN